LESTAFSMSRMRSDSMDSEEGSGTICFTVL
jgi:hypothetical protein